MGCLPAGASTAAATAAPANAPRALLVKELQALVWEPRPSALELERLLNAMVAYEDKDLGGQAQQHPSVIDELRVVRHVIKLKSTRRSRQRLQQSSLSVNGRPRAVDVQ